jgi:preprotein translocase subunit SecA
MTNRLFTKLFGTRFDREQKRIQPIVDAIHKHEVRLKELTDGTLQAQTAKFRGMIAERTGALAADVERLKHAKHDRRRLPRCARRAGGCSAARWSSRRMR